MYNIVVSIIDLASYVSLCQIESAIGEGERMNSFEDYGMVIPQLVSFKFIHIHCFQHEALVTCG